ncbi:MAG: hypothetical protein IPO82_06790 [Betaproteobacteria bacterium]|nr:hypothetical protein [Betaproteobacteria bacterium]MBK9674931.1 hypothetical protein [Betaproteobacteria bacterium]
MNFAIFAERSGHLDPESIRSSLAVIQDENPLLQVCIRWTADHGLRFEPTASTSIDLACRTVDADDWQRWIEKELAHPFPPESAPLMRCRYLEVPSPERSVLVLVFHHSIADGRSGIELLRRLIDCIATRTTLRTRSSVLPLRPMHQAFPPRFRWVEQPGSAKQVKDALIADYKRHGRATPMPWLTSDAPTRTPRFIRVAFPPEMTQRLLELSRRHEASVHGALCAAQLVAQYQSRMERDPATLFLSFPVDMRALVEPTQPLTPVALYASLISAAFPVDTNIDFWVLAREIVAQTRRQMDRGEGHMFFHLYGLDGTPVKPDRMEPFTKLLLSTWQNTMVSNIGKVAAIDSDPEVDAISFALCPMPYQTLFTSVSTYRGRLLLNIGYDAGKVSDAIATKVAAGVRDALQEAAG